MIQLTAVVLLSVLLAIVNVTMGRDFFIGGMICFIPNVTFAKSWLSFFSARYPGQMLVMFYFGEVIKFVFMVALLLLVFKFLNVQPMATIIGFVIAQAALFLGPLVKSQ